MVLGKLMSNLFCLESPGDEALGLVTFVIFCILLGPWMAASSLALGAIIIEYRYI